MTDEPIGAVTVRRGPMSKSNFAFNASLVLILVVLAANNVGCGAMNPSPTRMLESIAVIPTSANARNFPLGQVQFTATGTFSQPPSPAPVTFVAPYSGSWMISDPNIATINQSGLAQCVSAASGTVTITAIASSGSIGPGKGMSTAVSGTAKLTCP